MLNTSIVTLVVLGLAAQGAAGFSTAPKPTLFGLATSSTRLKAEESSSTDILNTPTFLKKKLEVLKTDIAAAEASLGELKTQVEAGKEEWDEKLSKLEAEAKTIQTRLQSAQGSDEAKVAVVQKMLDVLANFDMAFGAITPETDEDKAVEDEYKATYKMIQETFDKLGVTEVDAVGTEFNYEVHEAVMMLPSEEYDEGFVCQELAKGYKLGERLIRPAQVAVVG